MCIYNAKSMSYFFSKLFGVVENDAKREALTCMDITDPMPENGPVTAALAKPRSLIDGKNYRFTLT